MKSIKFVDTKRFSPVIYGDDLPWEEDYFHMEYKNVTKDFLRTGEFLIDDEWWDVQYERCISGYTVENAIEIGGDAFTTERMEYNEENGTKHVWGNNIIVNNNGSIYFPELDYTSKNREIWIPGKMYFYLNFWKIRRVNDAGTRKEVLNPKFTDLSFENWHIRERMRKEDKDNLFCKARQKGLSEEEACDTGYEYLFLNDSQSVIIGGEDFYNDNTMKMVSRGLEYLTNTQFYKEPARGGDSMSYKKSKNTGSEIYSRTCKNNSQSISGLTPSKAHHEEIGIWKRGLVAEVSKTIDPSIEAEGVKTGFKIFTGCVCKGMRVYKSSGEIVNIEDLKKEDGILGYNKDGVFIDRSPK